MATSRKAKKDAPKRDLYQEVTDRIIEIMKDGKLPWHKPWRHGRAYSGDANVPHNASTGVPYTGVNQILLWSVCHAFGSPQFLTFNQGRDMGGMVRKGEKGVGLIFFKPIKVKDTNAKGEEEIKQIPMLKNFTVFHVSQFDNLDPSKFKSPTPPPAMRSTSILELAKMHRVDLSHGGNEAFFASMQNRIQMPHQDQFKNIDLYNATLAHELTHWTGHPARLNRSMGNVFGTTEYAFEELIAELGSAFLSAQMDLPVHDVHHGAYLQSWLKALQNDKKAIFKASRLAREACEYLIAPLQDKEASEAA